MLGTFFGALFIGFLNNGLNLMGLDTFVQDVFKGAIILLAVSVISRQTQLKLIVDALVRSGVQQVYIGREIEVLKIPVRAIFGLADPVVPWQQASELPANVGVHFVRGGGHMPHWSEADLVVDLLDDPAPG